jgi:hypothetical protein
MQTYTHVGLQHDEGNPARPLPLKQSSKGNRRAALAHDQVDVTDHGDYRDAAKARHGKE